MSVAVKIAGWTVGAVLSVGIAVAAEAHGTTWQDYGPHARLAGLSGHSEGHLQCVPFARMDSGIQLSGNAYAWWDKAAGLYQRGTKPESGSVLSFQANGAMRLGHVAVVSEVLDGRTVTIDQANWSGPGQVSRNVMVVDVSSGNDWSAVRVGLGHTGEFGSIYPTNGFIYNRPDTGTLIASAGSGTPIPVLNPPPRDLRNRVHEADAYDEVAEAPEPGDSQWHRRESFWHRRVSYSRLHHVARHHHT